jgi:hypothetical protein
VDAWLNPDSSFLHILGVKATQKPFGYSLCTNLFSVKCALEIHLRIHTGDKSYVCTVCIKLVAYLSHLQFNLKVHTGEKPLFCTQCSKLYELKISWMKETSNCFLIQKSLIGHMRVHTGEKPSSCFKCTKLFVYQSSLLKHYRVHTGRKPYSSTFQSHLPMKVVYKNM